MYYHTHIGIKVEGKAKNMALISNEFADQMLMLDDRIPPLERLGMKVNIEASGHKITVENLSFRAWTVTAIKELKQLN